MLALFCKNCSYCVDNTEKLSVKICRTESFIFFQLPIDFNA